MICINQLKELDVSKLVNPGGKNILAVKIYPAQKITGVLEVKWSTKTGHGFRVFPVSVFRFVWR